MHRIAIELVNPGESDTIVQDRATRRAWLEARNYRVLELAASSIERDLEAELGRLAALLPD